MALQQAQTEEAVFALVHEHLQRMPEGELALLPETLRPHVVRSAADISTWALHFNREDLDLPRAAPSKAVVREMALLFTAASHRLAELAHAKAMRRTTARRDD